MAPLLFANSLCRRESNFTANSFPIFFCLSLLQEKVFWHAQSLEEKTLLSCNQLVSPFFVSHTSCVYIFFVKVAPEACDADRYMAVSFWAY